MECDGGVEIGPGIDVDYIYTGLSGGIPLEPPNVHD